MFCHGIHYSHLLIQYPILSPRLTILRQKKVQQLDRVHLIEKFGFEPVHFLESSEGYTLGRCIKSCQSFGDVIFVFKKLPLPILQLSANEVGVPTIDTRKSDYIFVSKHHLLKKVSYLYPGITIHYKEFKYL